MRGLCHPCWMSPEEVASQLGTEEVEVRNPAPRLAELKAQLQESAVGRMQVSGGPP